MNCGAIPEALLESQNAERSVVLSTDGRIDNQDVFAHLSLGVEPEPKLAVVGATARDDEDMFALPLTEAKQAFEQSYLENHLKGCNGQINGVAARSGRYRADVYRLLARYNIDHTAFKP